MLKAFFNLFYRIIPILAFLFGGIYLISLDFSDIKFDTGVFLLSIGLLWALFLFRVYIWYLYLIQLDLVINFNICIVSRFRFILTKYLPGKIWLHLGAGAVQKKYLGQNIAKGTLNAVVFQLINNLAGFFIGGAGLILLFKPEKKMILLSLIVLLLILILHLLSKQRKVRILRRIPFIKPDYKSFAFTIPKCRLIFLLLVFQWIILGSAYYILMLSTGIDVSIKIILLQPLANNLGMIAVFTPGGIGVREGFMIAYLTQFGLTVEKAGMLAILSRFWFVIVEFISFIFGLVVEAKLKKATY